jgi:hypothetical protein
VNLNLAENQLTGGIPAQLGSLSNLESLTLYDNQLTGSIPPELGSLSNLESLLLWSNRLTGGIPTWIGSLTQLRGLQIGGNRFTGVIPTQLGSLPNLERLSLGSNKLTGLIPDSLTNLTSLLDNESNFRYNALYTTNPALEAFLNTKQLGNDWVSFQTVAPAALSVDLVEDTSVSLIWAAIPYTADAGGYQIYYTDGSPGVGPYTWSQTTADKSAQIATVTGLSPNTTYHFRVRTVTFPHAMNSLNLLHSEYTSAVSATTTFTDSDGDGTPDSEDDCPGEVDTGLDDDNDGTDNACDDCPNDEFNDRDSDGTCGDVDNCPDDANNQADDGDSDGIGNECDNCPQDANGPDGGTCKAGNVGNPCMGDGDCGVGGICSMDQEDSDNDLIGDVCEDDSDNDGIPDDGGPAPCAPGQYLNCDDNCPEDSNPNQADYDLDGTGNECDEDADGDGHISFLYEGGDDCYDLDHTRWEGECGSSTAFGGGGGGKVDDGDGIKSNEDNCPADYNPPTDWEDIHGVWHSGTQKDTDRDGDGDECDTCPYDPENDADEDGVCAAPPLPGYCPPEGDCGVVDLCADSQCGNVDATGCCPSGVDEDGDGSYSDVDCNDSNPNIYPGAAEECNEIDDNCDAVVDEGCAGTYTMNFEQFSSGGENYSDWLPEPGKVASVTAVLRDDNGEAITPARCDNAKYVFLTSNVSAHSGAFTNDAIPGLEDMAPDPDTGKGNIEIICNDYGGSITIRVTAKVGDCATGVTVSGDFTLPMDTDGDGLADRWELNMFGNLDQRHDDDPDQDELTNLEEYRGFMWGPVYNHLTRQDGEPTLKEVLGCLGSDPLCTLTTDSYQTHAWVAEGEVAHFRTHPQRRDLFMEIDEYDFNTVGYPTYVDKACDCPFAIGAAFHDPPAKVDVHVVSLDNLPGFMSFDITAWKTNIDVAFILNERSDTHGQSDGDIDYEGIRDWEWDIKGQSNTGTASAYGSLTTTYQIPLDNYFDQLPYEDHLDLLCEADILDPIDYNPIRCEDQNDNGVDDNESGLADPAGNTNLLEGDILSSPMVFAVQDPAFHSAFDVDHDGLVEHPLINDPYHATTPAKDDNYQDEYSRWQVLKHTITHELGHAVGVSHSTSCSNCLMSEYSINWRRDGVFTADEALQIRIHNDNPSQ